MAAKRERTSGETQKILKEARERFNRCVDWEATSRSHFRDDVKFAEGDAYNNYQWPANELNRRDKRPSLTINRVRQHNLDILNDARQSQVAVKVRPLRGGASYDSAEILDGVIKHIEYISNAESAYQHALSYAVKGGIGWIRLVTDYVADDSFDQEIYIRRVPDPLSIYLDPDIIEFDGSDAKFGFVFTEMDKEEFDKAYPSLKDTAASNELAPDVSWGSISGGQKVRIAEYFRCVPNNDQLVSYIDPDTGDRKQERKSKIEKQLLGAIIDDPDTALRSVVYTKVEHFKIIGDTLAEDKVWPGRYVPLLRCVGEETVIDGMLDRKGHTRALLDSQRMFNYNASASVEYGALQTKSPWVGPIAAIEETQNDWENANTENKAFLGYKHVDDEGNPIPAPTRPQPPSGAPVFMQGMRDALEQMYLASGQNQADFGQPSNERSGVAIENRKREGDKATYHYLDHQSAMIRYLGKQILDLLPHVYDTERVVKYRDDAGNEGDVHIDPNAPQHFQQEQEDANDPNSANKFTLNPNLGVYDVQADVGPAYATRRQEAFQAFSTLLGANKELFALVGDIWMRFADIPGGEEAAERLRRMVPQQAMTDGPAPDVVHLQGQLKAATDLIGQLNQKLADKTAKDGWETERNTIKGYDAVTGRVKALEKALALDPGGLMVLVKEVIEEAQAQSAGGNAAMHVMDDHPASEDIHKDLGGSLQPPAPHTPPVDPNPIIAQSMAPEPDAKT
jgi:hypothetical protein